MNPNCFEHSLYCGTVGVSIFDIFIVDYPLKLKRQWNVLGYCNASELRCRPKDCGYAIMIEADERNEIVKCWMHLEDYEFNSIFVKET